MVEQSAPQGNSGPRILTGCHAIGKTCVLITALAGLGVVPQEISLIDEGSFLVRRPTPSMSARIKEIPECGGDGAVLELAAAGDAGDTTDDRFGHQAASDAEAHELWSRRGTQYGGEGRGTAIGPGRRRGGAADSGMTGDIGEEVRRPKILIRR